MAALLEGSKSLLKFADDGDQSRAGVDSGSSAPPKSSGFIPRSRVQGAMLRELHISLLEDVEAEQRPSTKVQLLKVLHDNRIHFTKGSHSASEL